MSRPDTASECGDQEEDWRQMRAAIKARHSGGMPEEWRGLTGRSRAEIATMPPTPSMAASTSAKFEELSAEYPPPLAMERSRTCPAAPCSPVGGLSLVAVPVKAMHSMRTKLLEQETAYLEGMRNDAHRHESQMYDSVIKFLEMHNLSRGYALGLAAHGMEDLSQLLLAEETELNHAIEGCCMDAMDEILFKEAIQTARAR